MTLKIKVPILTYFIKSSYVAFNLKKILTFHLVQFYSFLNVWFSTLNNLGMFS